MRCPKCERTMTPVSVSGVLKCSKCGGILDSTSKIDWEDIAKAFEEWGWKDKMFVETYMAQHDLEDEFSIHDLRLKWVKTHCDAEMLAMYIEGMISWDDCLPE